MLLSFAYLVGHQLDGEGGATTLKSQQDLLQAASAMSDALHQLNQVIDE